MQPSLTISNSCTVTTKIVGEGHKELKTFRGDRDGKTVRETKTKEKKRRREREDR
jgi:hypothetical protein